MHCHDGREFFLSHQILVPTMVTKQRSNLFGLRINSFKYFSEVVSWFRLFVRGDQRRHLSHQQLSHNQYYIQVFDPSSVFRWLLCFIFYYQNKTRSPNRILIFVPFFQNHRDDLFHERSKQNYESVSAEILIVLV